MTTDSPVAILFNTDGIEVNVKPGVAIPANTSAILSAGTDGTNSRFISVDSSGRQIVAGAGTAGSGAGGLITIQGDPAGTPVPVTGSISVANPSIGITGAAVPSSATQMGATDGTNLQVPRVFDVDSGGGTQYTLGVNLRLSASGGSVEFGTASNPIRIDPTGSTTQPISAASLPLPTGAATETTLGTRLADATFTTRINTLGQKTMANSTPVVLASDQSAIPVSQSGAWSVTANIGTSGALALDATLTGGTARTKITDGTNNAAVKAASTAPVPADPALVVAISPNSSISTNADGYVTTAAPSYTNNTFQPLSLTTTGALRIDGSAVTQPVSGTVAATQSGTWTVQPGNTPNTTPWLTTISQGGNSATVTASNALKVDGSAVTQPVSGTVTANAGTGSFTVIGTGTDNTTNSTAKLPVLAARANTSAPTWADGNMVPLSVDTAGALRITGSITAANASIGLNGSAIPTSSTQTGGTDGTNLQPFRVFDVDSGAGTQYVQGVSLRLSASGGSVEFGTATNPIRIDPTGSTTQPVSGTVTANAGTGNFTVVQATAANLNATVVQGTAANLRAQTASESATGSATPATAGLAGGAVTTAAPTYTTGNLGALSLTTGGLLRVDGSGATQPVSGTVAATQSGTWNITNISGTISLPTGAATETSLAKLTLAQGSTTSGQSGTLMQGAVTTAAPTYTTAQTSPLSLTTAGALRIDGSSTTQPVSGTVTSNQGTANTLANAWSMKITDTTNGPVAVKAASTAAVAGDSALVVAVSPNNSVTVTQATAANLNAQVVGPGASGAAVSGNPVRVAGSDGTNTRNILTDSSGRLAVTGAAADGAAVTGNPVLIGGTDGTNAQTIATNTNGAVLVDLQSSAKSVYGATVRSLSPPATPTDMVTVTGSATKTIRVLRIILSAIQTTGASQEFLIIKRSTANTGGTSTTATNVPFATSFAAATATVRAYTANPTTGTAVGTINVTKFFVPAGGTAQRNDYVFDFSNNGLYPGIVLSGTSEVLALNFNGAALPGGLNVDCTIEWSEE
jgi:hypothetical protein